MRFRTRAFLICFIPFALLLTCGFWMIQRFVQQTVREGLRTSLRESQHAIAGINTRSELQDSRFLEGCGGEPGRRGMGCSWMVANGTVRTRKGSCTAAARSTASRWASTSCWSPARMARLSPPWFAEQRRTKRASWCRFPSDNCRAAPGDSSPLAAGCCRWLRCPSTRTRVIGSLSVGVCFRPAQFRDPGGADLRRRRDRLEHCRSNAGGRQHSAHWMQGLGRMRPAPQRRQLDLTAHAERPCRRWL